MIDEKKICDGFGVVDVFAETIGRIEQIGSCRRLTFVTRNALCPDTYDVAVRLVISAEALLDLAQAAAADRPMPREFSAMPSSQLAN
jgi:hypothetical protein